MSPLPDIRSTTRVAALLVAAACGPAPLLADEPGFSTQQLEHLCGDPDSDAWNKVGQWFCPGYIRGLIDGAFMQAMHSAGGVEGHRQMMQFCVPEGATTQQAIDAVRRFMADNPERWSEMAAATVTVALAAAWPCTGGEGPSLR